MHHNKDVRFADLTDKELDKIKDTETFINSQPDHASRGEEIILLAYKQEVRHT
ncbi:MAG: hypothetical protein SCK29_13480 [Bacillota bacterium]|nr:hypothetical protein [Bacillota bacterium]MDW7685113.1 hypothetical protein [Bacillota bacterium]